MNGTLHYSAKPTFALHLERACRGKYIRLFYYILGPDFYEMERCQLNVDVTHYRDEDIWVATSDDIVGMVVESEGIAKFLTDVVDVAMQLLEINEQINAEQLEMTRLCLHVKHTSDDRSVPEDCGTPEFQLTYLQLATA